MPSGKTHATLTAAAAAGTLAAGHIFGLEQSSALALAGGCLAGILVTPDLDVNEKIHSHAFVKENGGRILAAAWRTLWLPYSRLMPHRHWLTHTPLVGTTLRLGYLALIAWLVLLFFGQAWPWDDLPVWWAWAYSGLAAADILHWYADLSLSRYRKLWRRGRRLMRLLA